MNFKFLSVCLFVSASVHVNLRNGLTDLSAIFTIGFEQTSLNIFDFHDYYTF